MVALVAIGEELVAGGVRVVAAQRPAVLGAPDLGLRVVGVDVEPVSARVLAAGGRADV